MLKKVLFSISLLISGYSIAQNSTASPYSLGGLGDVTFRGNAINRMMGGISVYADSIHANLNNPASLGELKLTTFSVGVHYRNTQLISDATNEDVASGSLDYIAVSIPTKHFSFSFGVMPFSSVGYQLQSLDDTNEQNILNRYEGKGGVNKTFISVGLKVFKFLNIGGTFNFNFGSISSDASRQEENVDFGTFLRNSSQIRGIDYQLGAHLKVPLSKKFSIDAFATFSPEHSLTSENEQSFFTRSVSTQTVGTVIEVDLADQNLDKVDLTIGSKYELGLGFGQDKKWLLGAQYTAINSGNFQNDFIQLNNVSYENGSRLSVGGYFIPNYSSITNYWKRMAFRAGFRQEISGIMINNTSLEETGISFGVSLPLGGYYSAANVAGYSSLNIGFELGKRGVNTNGLIEENYWSIRLGASLNDLWFIKRKYN
ncbi:hypothetical protein OAP39_02705 [Flavobacteriaceae bacterium]|nr:hypothetical protein [Flavobacteriaceae bacterium]